MGFLDKAKTILFGDQNNRGAHEFLAGFLPAIVPPLVATGAVALGAPVAVVPVAVGAAGVGALSIGAGVGAGVGAGAIAATGAAAAAIGAATGAAAVLYNIAVVGAATLAAVGAKKEKEKEGYNFKKHLIGGLTGCALGATLVFNVAAAHLPQEQPKSPVAGPVPSTLHIEPRGGELCKNFNAETTVDEQGRGVYILTVPKGCAVPSAVTAVPR